MRRAWSLLLPLSKLENLLCLELYLCLFESVLCFLQLSLRMYELVIDTAFSGNQMPMTWALQASRCASILRFSSAWIEAVLACLTNAG